MLFQKLLVVIIGIDTNYTLSVFLSSSFAGKHTD